MINAAGAVLWRPSARHGVKVAVVHRPHYDDLSLPKGKAEQGETAPMTAAREVFEETGYPATVGRQLTVVTYSTSSGAKRVTFFAARARTGKFVASKEVDRVSWLPLIVAAKRLTYRSDRLVLEAFSRAGYGFNHLLLVRHAKAGHRESYAGPDEGRPLDERGRVQAEALTDELTPFGPRAVYSAPPVRCRETVEPLAKSAGLTIVDDELLAEDAYRDSPAAARRRLVELAAQGKSTGAVVVCSQGGVIPGVIKSMASLGDVSLPNVSTPKGAYWMLTLRAGTLIQADPYGPPGS